MPMPALRYAISIVAVFFAVSCDGSAVGSLASRRPLLIADVTVVDVVNSRRLRSRSVLVEEGRITAIGRKIDIPQGAVLVDGRGKFLVPGLIDMHVHLFNNASHRPANTWAFALFVANGVTGVREMSTLSEQIPQIAQWNDAVDRGELLAPRVLAAGMPVRGRSESDARLLVRDAKASGAGFIKVFSEVPASHWQAIVEESRLQHMPIDGHAPSQVAWLETARAGQRTIEHLMQVFEACSTIEDRILASRKSLDAEAAVALRDAQEKEVLDHFDRTSCERMANAVAVLNQAQVPTLVLSHFENMAKADFTADDRWHLLRTDEQARWRRNLGQGTADDVALAALRRETSCRIVRTLNAAGVPLLAGTDTPMPLVYPGYSLHDEIELLAACGLSNAQALQAATIKAASVLNLASTTGSVDIGKRADLVLLDDDPLRDLRHLRAIRAVVLDGRLLQRSELDSLLEAPDSKNP